MIITIILDPVTVTTTPTTTGPSTRDRLVAAAIEVFVDQGYEQARVQDIARAAGLTTGAIYANFRDKRELLLAAIADRSAAEVEALLQAAANTHRATCSPRSDPASPSVRTTARCSSTLSSPPSATRTSRSCFAMRSRNATTGLPTSSSTASPIARSTPRSTRTCSRASA